MKEKYYFVANASYSDNHYKSGRIYELTESQREACGQSCITMTEYIKLYKPKNLGITTENIITPAEEKKPENILIMKSFGIGNIINMTPVIKAVRKEYPDAKIDFLVDLEYYKTILDGCEYIRNQYSWQKDEAAVKAIRYDLIIDGLPSACNKKELTYNKLISGDNADMKTTQEVTGNLNLLNELITSIHDDRTFAITKKPKEIIKGKYFCISAGFSDMDQYWKKKNWGYKNYAELIVKLQKEYPTYKIVILGIGKDKKVYTEYNKIKKTAGNVINKVDKYTIQEAAYIIKGAEAMIANDTGLMHVSAAVGTRTIALFGCTPALKAFPLHSAELVDGGELMDCAPCMYSTQWTKCTDTKCMQNITPERVFNQVKSKNGITKKKIKYKIGILTATFNRYDLLAAYFNNILTAFNHEDVKFYLIDDGSTEDGIPDLCRQFKKSFKGEFIVQTNETNGGKINYYKNLKKGVIELMDCEYILFQPEDCAFNNGVYDLMTDNIKYFKKEKDLQAITYFLDSRLVYGNDNPKYFIIKGEYNKYFWKTNKVDGLAVLFRREFLQDLDWKVNSEINRTMVWHYINDELVKHLTLVYKQSLYEHTGNMRSTMWSNIRHDNKINGLNLNLFESIPALTGKTLKDLDHDFKNQFNYSKEWYEKEYHSKREYKLPERKFDEIMKEWSDLGYEKRLIEVFDEVDSLIDFSDYRILDIGCHHGKSVYWLWKKYNGLQFDCFDFSSVAVDWCLKEFPAAIQKDIKFKEGDVREFPFDKKYQVITCLDVIEHLPPDVYEKMISEIYDHLKPSGYLIIYCGQTILDEHINIRSNDQLINDFDMLKLISKLPKGHLIFQK